jgi:PAS domain S-box-containing protein
MSFEPKSDRSNWRASLVQAAIESALLAASGEGMSHEQFSSALETINMRLKSRQVVVLYCEGSTGEWRLAGRYGRPTLASIDTLGFAARSGCSGSGFLSSRAARWLSIKEFGAAFGFDENAFGDARRVWLVPAPGGRSRIGVYAFIDPGVDFLDELEEQEVAVLAEAWGLLLWFVVRPSKSILPETMRGAFAWRMDIKTLAMLDLGKQAIALSGYEEKEWFKKPGFMVDHSPSEDTAQFQNMLNQCRRDPTVKACEHRLIKKSGETLWFKTEIYLDEGERGFECFRGISMDITQLKGGQQIIQNQLAFLKTLTENLGEGFAVIDRDGILQFVNPAGLRILDATKDEIIGINVTDAVKAWDLDGKLLNPNDYPIVKALREGRPIFDFQTLLPQKNGNLINVSSSGCPIYRDGAVIGAVAVFHDVTENVRAGRAIRERAEQFEQLANAVFEGIAIHERGQILYVNKALADIFGYTPQAVIGRNVLEFAAPESASIIKSHISSSTSDEFEAIGLTQERRKISLLIHSRNVLFSGRVLRMASVQDITARVKQRNALQLLARAGSALSSSLDLEVTLEELAHIVVPDLADWCMVDLVGASNTIRRVAVVHSNPQKAAAAQKFKELEEPKLNDLYGTGLTLREGRPVMGSSEKEGVRRLVNNESGIGLLNELGVKQFITLPLVARSRPVGVLTLVYCDVERTYSREDLVVAEELALRAALAIDNARLYEAEREAVKRREEVVEAVAHDLKNPLTAIQLGAELVQNKPSQLSKAFGLIKKSVEQMQTLIYDLLDLAKLDSGISGLALEEVSVNSLIENMLGVLQPLASSKNLQMRIDLGEQGSKRLKIDQSKSLQVLSNVVGNAIKFTPNGGEITIKVSPFTEKMFLFEVSDTGPGIDREALPYVFDRFWQHRGQRKHGTGLGLSIAKAITEAHGGMIWVESRESRGASFYFTLPMAAPSEMTIREMKKSAA